MAAKRDKTKEKSIEAFRHDEASRKNIPSAELSTVARKSDMAPVRVSYERRNPDLDPQLIWRGKYDEDDEGNELIVRAAPLYIQEKVHPKALIDELKKESEARAGKRRPPEQLSLFADFNGIAEGVDKTEFYKHDQNWSNRMILGDSLQVMAGLAEREGLRGQVQCIYFDPPYGIKFNSNFQWSTTSRDVKDNKPDHITREPEQVKAFRDTWRDGIHSYLSYLRDRLIAARELLAESGSIFVQIGDENVHRVRAVMDEVFGDENFCSLIQVQKTGSQAGSLLATTVDFVIWYARCKPLVKYNQLYSERIAGHVSSDRYDQIELGIGHERRLTKNELLRVEDLPVGRIFQHTSMISSGQSLADGKFVFQSKIFYPGAESHWKTTVAGMNILGKAGRIAVGKSTIRYKRYLDDFSVVPITDRWESMQIGTGLIYVVQTSSSVVQRCLLMATAPGDLVLDPTCGSGTTAYVAEQWGRRWITIDTSRVALALARARIMGARYPYYLLADSKDGQIKEGEITKTEPSTRSTYGNIRLGFVYSRVPHITLKSIANNTEIDIIWNKWQEKLKPLQQKLNSFLKQAWEEWEIPREAKDTWPDSVKKIHSNWWTARASRQKEIDASIAAKAEAELLYDKPFIDKKKVRVAGPFTVESLSPHRMLAVDENDNIIDPLERVVKDGGKDFIAIILDELRVSGVQQAHKEDKINFSMLKPWPGRYICAGPSDFSVGR